MNLRPYQQEAVEAVYRSLSEQTGNPAVCLPTGSGKSIVIAKICVDTVQQWNGRVFVVSHVQEILQQNAEKIRLLMNGLGVGIYSAGLNKRDTDMPVIVAGIQSVHRRACDLGRADLVIIDECHLLSDDADSMYRRFLNDLSVINPNMRVIGFTATPFRLKEGLIYGPDRLFSHLAYDASVRELIRDGYLSPLISRASKTKIDTGSLHIRAGEFVADEVETLMDRDELVQAACREIIELTKERRSILIFASGINHAKHVEHVLREIQDANVATVFGSTTDEQRSVAIEQFRRGKMRFLINVGVFCVGFDAPNVDCVVLLRPTMSAGLYIQQVGRGFRLAPGKTDCLVLDYGGNVLRHGPVDQLLINTEERGKGTGEAPAKECPECHTIVAAAYARCPQCGYEFPPPERKKHDAKASAAGVLSGQFVDTKYAVKSVMYGVHTKRGGNEQTPKTLRVEYEVGFNQWQKEWVCVEHQGFARNKAELWWKERSHHPCPKTAGEAAKLARQGVLAEPTHITVRETAGEDFPRIIAWRLGEKPAMREPGADEEEAVPVSAVQCDENDEPPF